MPKIVRLPKGHSNSRSQVAVTFLKSLVSQSQLDPGGRQRRELARTTLFRIFKGSFKARSACPDAFAKRI
jgi:hypothetical protein